VFLDNVTCIRNVFFLSLRNGHVYLSFDSLANNLTLISAALIPYSWCTHVAVVYDAIARQQIIYINGRVDVMSNTDVTAYTGSPDGGSTSVGRATSAAYPLSYFNG
jgi:hypothetical protein